MGTVLVCSCKSTFQDKEYGLNRRYFNSCKELGAYRCTVCGKEQKSSVKKAEEVAEKK